MVQRRRIVLGLDLVHRPDDWSGFFTVFSDISTYSRNFNIRSLDLEGSLDLIALSKPDIYKIYERLLRSKGV